MGRNISFTRLTKEEILRRVSQVSIFSAYLNLPEHVIQRCIDRNELICSPIREDHNPTCGFRYNNKGKLRFRDFAGYTWGDCFDIVALVMRSMYGREFDVSDTNDFTHILRHITLTFKNIFYGTEKDINLINGINASIENIKRIKPNIEVVVRQWSSDDMAYWKRIGIDKLYLNLHFVYPVEQYYINMKVNPNPKYYYRRDDPCYCYLCGTDRNGTNSVKLYFPLRQKHSLLRRFITNFNHLEGIMNLDRHDYDCVVITKSSKDRLCIGCNIDKMNLGVKVGVINIPHENYRLRQNEYDWIKGKLVADGRIYSLMDNDRTGKREAIWLRQNYGIQPLLIPRNYGCKDFAELAESLSFTKLKKFVLQTIIELKNEKKQ